MRVCIVYDCLFPYTVGGAERWYRNLAEGLAAAGNDVTYLTRLQWDEAPELEGVRVVPVSAGGNLYTADGRRRIAPPLWFGAGVLRHLARHGRGYDVLHTASFPYFSMLAAGALRRLSGFELFVDWHEVWSKEYWRRYLGTGLGRAGWGVQRMCLGLRQHAFCFSRLHEHRLREAGLGDITVLEGQYAGKLERPEPLPAEPVVVFAGRLIPEKNAAALLPAVARVRDRLGEVRLEIYGQGPELPRILAGVERQSLDGVVELPGFVEERTLERALARALCLVLPSTREGYGLVVVESAARGVPAVVVPGQDNAALELVEDGVNGVVARSAEPADLAEAILRVHERGDELRRSTAEWFERNAHRLSLDSSLEQVLERYRHG